MIRGYLNNILRGIRYISLCLACVILSATVFAEEKNTNKKNVQPVITAGITFGGDEISKEEIENIFGDDDTDSIDAGEMIYFAAGAAFNITNTFQLQTTFGIHLDSINGSNGDTGFYRYPLEVIGFYKNDKFRIGGGISHHLNPKYERDVDGDPKINVDFDDTTGLVIQGDYLITRQIPIGIRYMDIDYDGGDSVKSFDGSHIGIVISCLF